MFAFLLLPTGVSAAEELLFGMSTALSGPAAELGLNMRTGVEAAFAEANRRGGIQNLQLRLLTLDDGYEPSRTAPNMRTLIGEHRVLAVVGNVGTPTAVVAAPIAVERKTLFFGAYTGAGVLRTKPPARYVINYRASYAQETGAMVDALVQQFGFSPNEIALFTQRDAYGDAGYFGGIDALRRNGLKEERAIVHGRYERNTVAVENAAADILMADPPVRAVIMVGAYEPCAAFIKLAKDSGVEALFLNVSFVGAEPLKNALGSAGEGVIITQVVPHYQAELPVVTEYRKALSDWQVEAQPSFGSLEGYVSARILLNALRTIQGTIDRESVVDALVGLGTFDIGLGTPLRYGADHHQASSSVWPTVIRAGEIVPASWEQLHMEHTKR